MAREGPTEGGQVPWQLLRCGMHLRRSAFRTSARMATLASPALVISTWWAKCLVCRALGSSVEKAPWSLLVGDQPFSTRIYSPDSLHTGVQSVLQ